MFIDVNGFPVPIIVPPALGSPLYHTHCALVPNDPPLTFKSTNPDPHIDEGLATMEEGFVEGVLMVTVTSFEAREEQFVETILLKQVF